jgi:hypothetical protein
MVKMQGLIRSGLGEELLGHRSSRRTKVVRDVDHNFEFALPDGSRDA